MSDRHFEIDADIARASTPPNWLYTDPSVFAASRERIFAKSWQLVGDIEQVRVPGQVYPFTFLEGLLDEPLLLVRDRDDKLRCISNVCTHRGMLVCEHPGVESSLRCRYHGRKFDLNGKFTYMPEFEGTSNFPSPSDDLRPISLAQWGPFVFASIAPETAFDTWFRPVPERLNWLPIKAARFDAARSRDYLVNCNWILYCENYLEGFHIPFVHAGLSDGLEFGSYRTELFEHSNVQVGIARGGEPAIVPPPDSIDHGQQVAGYFFWLYPNLMFNVYPWGISVNIVKPLAVDRTRVSFLSYVWDASKIEIGVGGQLDRVEREDESIVEAVQRGLRSRIYERGRYSPTREQGTYHLHRMLAQRLGNS